MILSIGFTFKKNHPLSDCPWPPLAVACVFQMPSIVLEAKGLWDIYSASFSNSDTFLGTDTPFWISLISSSVKYSLPLTGVCPSAPAAPVAPVSPLGPCSPCGPCGPISPLSPLSPWMPCSPWGPVAPVSPLRPCSPWIPCNPCGPVSPFGPMSPWRPCNWICVSIHFLFTSS